MIKKLLERIGVILLILFDKTSSFFVFPAKRTKSGVLLVRVDNIGDFILWSGAAKSFKEIYPEQKITLIVKHTVKDLAAALPFWDEIWDIDFNKFRLRLLYRWKFLRKIRKANFDTAIQPTLSRHFTGGDSIIRATAAPKRIGSSGHIDLMDPFFKSISDRWYTRLIPASPAKLMELQSNAEFMQGLGLKHYKAIIPKLSLLTVLRNNLQISSPYFVLFPGTSWPGRQWPAEKFADLSEILQKKTGFKAVLCGDHEDDEICNEIYLQSSAELINLAGKTTLTELVEVIRNARFLIGNETSAIHIAAATGTRSICILGGGHYGRFLPYPVQYDSSKVPIPIIHKMKCFGCNWHCIYAREDNEPVPCIASIRVDHVVPAALSCCLPQTEKKDRI